MKYIRLYESKEYDREDIKNCFLDLVDNGFEINVFTKKEMTLLKMNTCPYILITRDSEPEYFSITDVKETLLFAIPYLEDQYNQLSII